MAKKEPSDKANAPEPKGKENKEKEKEDKKKEKEDKKKEKKEKKGGLFKKLLLAVIFLGIIGFLAAVIGFDFMGLREKYLRGVIDRIPVVNQLLPAPEVIDENADPRERLENTELIAQIDSLQSQLDTSNADKEDLLKRIDLYTTELERLRDVEAQQEQFKIDKAEFDEMIATNDPNAYAKFYESILPENADILYREVVGTLQQSQELKRYINMISTMDEKASAKMLETLLATDMDLVVLILENISSDQSGAIIEAMTTENAAAVIKRMAPTE